MKLMLLLRNLRANLLLACFLVSPFFQFPLPAQEPNPAAAPAASSLSLQQELQKLRETKWEGRLLAHANTLVKIGSLYRDLADPENALTFYLEALPLLHTIGNPGTEAAALEIVGILYEEQKQYQQALKYHEQALAVKRSMNDRFGEAASLHNMATQYNYLGQEDRALELYQQAERILEELGDTRILATTLNNIGAVYKQLGQSRTALTYYEQALTLRRQAGDAAGEAITLSNMGVAYDTLASNAKNSQELSSKAQECYQQALKIQRAINDKSGEATTLTNMGAVTDDQAKALDIYKNAYASARSQGDREHQSTAMNGMASVHEQNGSQGLAAREFSQSLAFASLSSNALLRANVLSGLSFHWRDAGNLSLAILFEKLAVNQVQEMRGKLSSLDKDLQNSFLESNAGYYRELADMLISQGRLVEALQVMRLLKQAEYSDFVGVSSTDRVEPAISVALTPAENGAAAAIASLNTQMAAVAAREDESRLKQAPDYDDLVKQELEVTESYVNQIQRLGTSFGMPTGTIGPQPQPFSSEDASQAVSWQRRVPEGSLVLFTLVAEEHYRVIVVSPTSIHAAGYSIKRDDLRRRVESLRKALHDRSSDPRASSLELYRVVLAPVEGELTASNPRTLVLYLDGPLRYVPMSALYDGQRYVVERYATVVDTLPDFLGPGTPLDPAQIRGAAMGISAKYEENFSPLPSVPGELSAIVQDPGISESHGVIPGTIKLNNDFTEKSLTEQLSAQTPVMHIASHFASNPGDDTHSFLLLAGKNEPGKGYHLTLSELRQDSQMRFDGVEILTLSACDTAMGGKSPDGREVDGLGTIAQKKGAKSVLASLWSVDDRSTGQLMAEFYERWLRTPGTSRAEALRQAQLDLLCLQPASATAGSLGHSCGDSSPSGNGTSDGYSHPYYWAPFILMGRWQ